MMENEFSCHKEREENGKTCYEERKKWLGIEYYERLEHIERKIIDLHQTLEMYPHLKWYTPHGANHLRYVESMIYKLIPDNCADQLTPSERFFLLAGAWLHDVGMLRGILGDEDIKIDDDDIRDQHHERSEKYIVNNFVSVGLREHEKEIAGLLARFHRRRCDIKECPETVTIPEHGTLRVQLLAAYLRIADALHVDQTRVPVHQYAIVLAYNIPRSSKLHWIKSMFVLGVEVDVKKSEIYVHFKHPLPMKRITPQENKDYLRTLNSIYNMIIDGIRDEITSVGDIMFRARISYFLAVKKKIAKVKINARLWHDFRSVIHYYYLIDNPSSSALNGLVLKTIYQIITANEDMSPPAEVVRRVRKFIEEITDNILRPRKCHSGLKNLLQEVSACLNSFSPGDRSFISLIKNKLKSKIEYLEYSRESLRKNAYFYLLNEDFLMTRVMNGIANIEKALQNYLVEETEENYQACLYALCNQKHTINIMLYGYSELALKTICGFRDAIYRILIKAFESTENNDMQSHEYDFEKISADCFRLFVCTGEPKNRNTFGGKVVFHDGVRYAQALAKRRFTKIYLTPDADVPTILFSGDHLTNNQKNNSVKSKSIVNGQYPHSIDYVLLGANGFDDHYFLHSAGHAMMAGAVKQAREFNKGTGFPKLILAVLNEKMSQEKQKTDQEISSDCNKTLKTQKCNFDSMIGKIKKTKERNLFLVNHHDPCGDLVREGWHFATSFGDELVRDSVFIPHDIELIEAIKTEDGRVKLYNPREDYVSFEYVDVVITQDCFFEKEISDVHKDAEKPFVIKLNNWNGSSIVKWGMKNKLSEKRQKNIHQKVDKYFEILNKTKKDSSGANSEN